MNQHLRSPLALKPETITRNHHESKGTETHTHTHRHTQTYTHTQSSSAGWVHNQHCVTVVRDGIDEAAATKHTPRILRHTRPNHHRGRVDPACINIHHEHTRLIKGERK